MGCAQSSQQPTNNVQVLPNVQQNIQQADDNVFVDAPKAILVGPTFAGKSCLMMRLANREWDFKHLPPSTIGAAYKEIIMLTENGKKVTWKLWDTAGQERYKSLSPVYCRGAHVCFLVYDITSRESFNEMQEWYNAVKKHCISCAFMVIGSKLDLNDRRRVDTEDAQKWAQQIDADYLEISSKTGENIHDLLSRAFRHMIDFRTRNLSISV